MLGYRLGQPPILGYLMFHEVYAPLQNPNTDLRPVAFPQTSSGTVAKFGGEIIRITPRFESGIFRHLRLRDFDQLVFHSARNLPTAP
jgi:hypothetical protein